MEYDWEPPETWCACSQNIYDAISKNVTNVVAQDVLKISTEDLRAVRDEIDFVLLPKYGEELPATLAGRYGQMVKDKLIKELREGRFKAMLSWAESNGEESGRVYKVLSGIVLNAFNNQKKSTGRHETPTKPRSRIKQEPSIKSEPVASPALSTLSSFSTLQPPAIKSEDPANVSTGPAPGAGVSQDKVLVQVGSRKLAVFIPRRMNPTGRYNWLMTRCEQILSQIPDLQLNQDIKWFKVVNGDEYLADTIISDGASLVDALGIAEEAKLPALMVMVEFGQRMPGKILPILTRTVQD